MPAALLPRPYPPLSPRFPTPAGGGEFPTQSLLAFGRWGLALVGAVAIGLGIFFPLLGFSLLGFVVVDAIVGAIPRRAPTGPGASVQKG